MALTQSLPKDANSVSAPLTPSVKAGHVTYNTSLGSAVDVTLQTTTSLIEVSAVNQGILMRYASTASTSNFDEYIQVGTTRHYVVPAGVTVVSFIQQAASATLVLIEK